MLSQQILFTSSLHNINTMYLSCVVAMCMLSISYPLPPPVVQEARFSSAIKKSIEIPYVFKEILGMLSVASC